MLIVNLRTHILLENRNGVFLLHYGHRIFRNTIDIFMAIVLKGKYLEMDTGGGVYGDGREESRADTSMGIICKVFGSDA